MKNSAFKLFLTYVKGTVYYSINNQSCCITPVTTINRTSPPAKVIDGRYLDVFSRKLIPKILDSTGQLFCEKVNF